MYLRVDETLEFHRARRAHSRQANPAPVIQDYYTHYYNNACSECVSVIPIVIPI